MSVRQAVWEALLLLTKRDRRLLVLAVGLQMGTSLLDLIGVVLLGLVGALAVTTVQSQPPPQLVQGVADAVGLGTLSNQALVMSLAAVAAGLLLCKSVISTLITRRVFTFLANRQALVSSRLTRELLSRPIQEVQAKSSQETSFALIQGTSAATVSILGQFTIFVTESSLLLTLGIGLLLVSPAVALASILFFLGVAWSLQRVMGKWATRAGHVSASSAIRSLNAIQEVLSAYREVTVLDRRNFYVSRVHDLQWEAARSASDRQFIQMFPKYMFEAAMVIGGLFLAAALFSTRDAVTSVGTLALFIAAATRVMPSILRLQGSALLIRSGAAIAAPTFELAERLGHPKGDAEPAAHSSDQLMQSGMGHTDFQPSVELSDVTFTYPGSAVPALSHVSLNVEAGRFLAIVGPSGAGKSTLVDAVLGVVQPNSGTILLGGLPPGDACRRWPGGVAYVPQKIALVEGTVRDNIALGLPRDCVNDDAVWDVLDQCQLAQFLVEERSGLDTEVGESGLRMSGGQLQRIGIARALYSDPRILVLDEATSSLDAETEASISGTLRQLKGAVTMLMVAHRLSTVRLADSVLYMDKGSILAHGEFDQVRRAIPAFDRQAQLMGLF